MRNKSTRSLHSFARLMALALCFVMMFMLAFVVVNKLNVDDSNFAVADNEEDDEAKGGTASVVADQGEITASMFSGVTTGTTGFPGTSTETQWTTTITFNNTVFGSNNVSNYLSSGSSNVGGVVGGTGSFTSTEFDGNGKESDHGWYSPHLYSVVNYTFSDFMLRLMASSDYTVTATMTSTLTKNESTSSYNDIHFLLLATSSKVKAMEGKQDNGVNLDVNDGNVTWKSESLSSGNKTATTGSQTFTATNSYLVMGWETQSGWNNHCDYTISNISITFTITLDTEVADSDKFYLSDGAAPVASSQYGLENSYVTRESGSGYAPYIENAKDAPVYYESIANYVKTDSVSNNNIKLQSYTNKSLNKDFGNIEEGNSTPYYKYAQTEFVDLYNYSGGNSIDSAIKKYGTSAGSVIGAGDRIFSVGADGSITPSETSEATHLKYASGIKSITINDTVFNMWDSNDYSQTKAITKQNSEEQIGYAQVKYLNRSRVVVSLYMTQNGTVQVSVEDYGGLSNRTKIEVGGIDTTAPNSSANEGTEISYEDCIGTSINSLNTLDWYKQSVLQADGSIVITENKESGYSPYIWFYTVDQTDRLNQNNIADSFDPIRTFENYEEVKNLGILPIAYGDISEFVYNFEEGVANAYGGKTQGNPRNSGNATSVKGPTGAGYYRFTFYLFDLAGNMGSVNTFYVRVDYQTAEYTVDLSYGQGDNKTTILPSQNGSWATDDITLKIKVNTVAFSGYTLMFKIDDEYHALVVDGFGDTTRTKKPIDTMYSFNTALVKYVAPTGKTTDVVGNKIEINSVKTDLGSLPVAIEYDGKNKEFTFTIKAQDKVNFAWITQFETNPGQYKSISDIEDDKREGHVESVWGKGVQILLDCTKPENPIMTDVDDADNDYLKDLNDYTQLPTDRVWYTQALKSYSAILNFYDELIESKDYVSDLSVYYAFKVVKTLDELNALVGYKELILSKSSNDLQEYFNHIEAITGDKFVSESTDLDINLISGQDAGMRVFYVWAEDQAGNKSDVNTYYMLADANLYSVSAIVKSNSALARNSANISFVNADGDAVTSFKRGEKILFTLGLEDGYVPFSLSLNNAELLKNYTQYSNAWTSVADFAYIETDGYSKVEYVVDNSVSLAKLATKQAFVFAHRKVVNYTIASTMVGYTSEPTDVKGQTVFSDIASKGKFEVRFFDSDNNVLYATADGYTTDVTLANGYNEDPSLSNPEYFVPTNVGKYYVALYIPKDNDTYVTEDFAMVEGEQVFSVLEYEIIKGTATITAKPTTSVYGENIVLEYTLSGVAESNLKNEGFVENEGDKIALALKVADFKPSNTYNVGSYQVVCTSDWSGVDNYNVVFEGATHTITQREVYVYALSGSKQYKEVDPQLKFGVKKSDFDAETQDKIFEGYRKDTTADIDGYIVYFADGRLSRESGEAVGKYGYLNTASMFDVNSNYRVVLQTNDTFEITQRVITLDVSGQSSVYPYGTVIADKLADINPSYKLSIEDKALASEIAELIQSLAIDASVSSDVSYDLEDYDSAKGYGFKLVTKESANIKIEIANDARYIVYISAQNVIVIKAKEGGAFEGIYGLVNGDSFLLPYSSDKFEIVGTPSATVTDVSWKASINATGIADAGNYIVIFTDAKLLNGETELADKVIVEQVVYTVNPANIVVKPVASLLAKTYGDEDDVYGIGFEIVSIAGFTPEQIATVMQIDVNTLKSVVSGVYARAIFDKNGEQVGYATRYDNATDNGIIIGTDGEYYGIAVASAFYTNNANFTVEATLNDDLRLAIDAKQLSIHTKDFVGISKYYDSTTDVIYGTNAMYNIADYLVRMQDDVVLCANAEYSLIGSPFENTPAEIRLDGFVLVGKDAHNYVLVDIVNDGVDCSVDYFNGEIDEIVIVRIKYIDNSNGSEPIYIKMGGEIAVNKSDISVSKQYDNSTKLTAGNITFKNGTGTELIASNKQMILVGGEFTGSDVGTNYLIKTIVVFIPFDSEHLDGITINNENNDVVISKTIYDGKSGVSITIQNIGAAITQRVLNADSFTAITAIDREYNKTNVVGIGFELADGALATGDTLQSVGLKLTGEIADANVGRHMIKAFGANENVIDKNYIVDIDSINSRFTSVEVEISKATLTPVVNFKEMTYSGKSAIQDADITGLTGELTTSNGILEGVRFNASKVSFTLSATGKADENVQANGLHNILVSGLYITFDNSLTQEDINNIVRNYKLAGSRYSSLDKKYVAIQDISEGFVEDYELIDFVVLNQKEIVLTTNDFTITEKVYDGTTKAEIIIDIVKDAEGKDRLVDPEHEKMLEVVASGKYEKPYARDNLKVTIDKDSIELRVKSGTDGEKIIGNYKLVLSYDPEIYGKIKPRPVAISASFGEQVYDGQESVKDSGIDPYTKDGVLNRDVCDIRTNNGAYYIDKNVAIDAEGNVIAKSATAYGVELLNGNTNNYTAVYTSKSAVKGNNLVAYIKNNGEWVYSSNVASEDEVAYYCYALETTQKYIEINDDNASEIEQAFADDKIVGFYKVDSKSVYMLTNDYVGTYKSLADPITYLRGEGTITKRVVRLSSDGITVVEGSNKYTKVYDGTTKFYGEEGVDFTVDENAVSNVVKGDIIKIKSVTAVFESVKVGSTNIVFTASGIDGETDVVSNYTTHEANAVLKVRVSAKITPLTIDAELLDSTRVYGSAEVPCNVLYTINGYKLKQDGKTLYMNFKEWLVVTGFIESIDDSVAKADEKYVESLYGRTYNLVDGEFVASDGVVGEYILLGGANDAIIEMPKANTALSSRANAGSVATAQDGTYTLTEGKANNYVFNRIYTDNSKLVIVKKTVYVVTETKDFTKSYGSANPEVKLSILDMNGANGLAANDQWNTLFKIGSIDYGPVVKLGIFNRNDGSITPADDYAKISADLDEGEVYVFYLEAPTGADYSSVKNYNVFYQGIDNVDVDANGNAVWNLALFKKNASTLTISLPELTGISVGSNEENVFTYSKGVNWINEVLRGELATDEVYILDSNSEKCEAINAGTYEGFITVKRYINANGDFVSESEKDANGYFIEWKSGDKVKITVNKQTINLWAEGMSVYYNGSEQLYSISKIGHTPIDDGTNVTSLGEDDFIITYEVYDSKANKFVATNEAINAGKYRVNVAFADTDEFELNHPNLAKGTSVKADLYILKAIVNVTISTDGYAGGSTMVDNSKITSLSAMFDANRTYSIGYSVAMDEKSNAENIAVDKSQTKLVVSKSGTIIGIDQIHEAGKYTFTIMLNDETLDENNYTINGGAGVLELRVSSIDDSNGNTIDLGNGSTTANRLVVKEVASGSTTANDMDYLATVKQHVAYMSSQEELSKNASVAAVYRVTLYCDDKVVSPDGEITVTVAIPDAVGKMRGIELYMVTEQGELQKLSDYKVKDGKIVFTADYISGLVFVDTNGEGLASWAIYTIVAVVVGVVLIVTATVVAIILRKRNMKKFDQ